MADYKKYKVGITVKENWASDISFEQLDYTLWSVNDGGDGCGYIALKDNIGVLPNSDVTTWRKATEAGQSIYDLAVKYHHFVGTEEEFEAQYQQALSDAISAAQSASAIDTQVRAAEQQRVVAEQERVSAENTRLTSESARVSAETERQSAENTRVSNEEARVSSEAERLSAETERQSAEAFRVRETASAITDANTARDQADASATRANIAATNAESKATLANDAATLANTKAQLANDKAALAETAGANANEKATLAQQKATYAETQGDYAKAQGDYAKAQGDIALADHERAESDHTRAESDHDAVKVYVDSLGAFDISAYHASGGVLAKYADLTAALGTNGANIPEGIRKGGMSVKFVQSYDNKYIRYNLLADSFTTDITQWAIDDAGVYIENPEFVKVYTDNDNKILWAIKTDGNIYYGAGIPPQVIDYIQQKIDELSLDEYEDIVTFLDGLEEGDTTLRTMLTNLNTAIDNEVIRATTAEDTKVDKLPGKSLIDTGYAESMSSVENPEWMDVKTDNEDRILEGIKADGTKVIGRNLKVIANMEVSGVSYTVIENPEYLAAWVDAEDKVIFGLKTDGKTYVGDADFLNDIKDNQDAINEIKSYLANFDNLDIDALSSITAVENPEFIEAKTDSEGKLLAGRTPDGAAFENVGFTTPKVSINGNIIENIQDPEGRTEIKTDAESKILSYRDSDGVLHENVGIESYKLTLIGNGLSDLAKDLRNNDFISNDWSDKESIEIPMPRCAVVNITNNTNNAIWPASKTADYQYYLQFWDMQGNYFKKPVIYNAQGNSSLGMPKKNAGFDIFADTWDGEAFTLKIGNWIPQDSFHLKAYYADYFVGVCAIAYKLFNQITATRDIFTNRDWKKALIPDKVTIGTGCSAMDGEDDKYSLDNDARCFPDGFPCIVYLNGVFYGVYSWQLKKHRDNYMMSKKNPKHIHLDGVIDWDKLFGANGDSSKIGWVDVGDTGFEIRNPKPKKKKDGWDLTCVDGTKYDADTNMKEIIGENDPLYDSSDISHTKTNETKQAILLLSTYITELQQMESDNRTATEIRTRLSEMFDVESFIDYLVFGDAVSNWDGFRKNWQWITYDGIKWFIEPYDLDGIFGWDGWGEVAPNASRYGNDMSKPSGWIIKYFSAELNTRYAELRDNGILTTTNILNIFREWIAAIGTDNLQRNHDKWPNDRDHYSAGPENTHYDNIYRVSNWLDARIAKCDEIYDYNQN